MQPDTSAGDGQPLATIAFCCAPSPCGRMAIQNRTTLKRLLHKLLGDRGERAAARFLRRQGYRLLARSYRCQYGEIDLIVRDGRQIVFVEVKTRSGTQCGQPFEAVDRIKQQKLTRLALYWLKAHRRLNERARFDVVSVIWLPDSRQPQIDHFQHAFEASS